MSTWDDSKKFVAETIRTILLGTAGAVAALLILKPWEKGIEYQAELDKTKLSIVSRVIDDFLAASYRYTSVAYDACRGNKEAIGVFQGGAFDNFRSAENRLSVYYGNAEHLRPALDDVQKLTGELGRLCNEGAPKEKWEAARKALKEANNKVALSALKTLKLLNLGDLDKALH